MSFLQLGSRNYYSGSDIMKNFNKLLSTTTDPLNVKFDTVQATTITIGTDIYTVASVGFTPNEAGGASMTYTSTSVNWARRKRIGDREDISISITGTTGGTASNFIQIDLPSTPANNNDVLFVTYDDNGTKGIGKAQLQDGTATARIRKADETNWALGTVSFFINGSYEIA